jgi:putative transposase
MKLNLPELVGVLEEIEFFERERTDRQSVGVAILLYNHCVSARKIERVLGWFGVDRSHVAIWKWIQQFGERLREAGRPAADLLAVVSMDETAISQQAEEFVLFAAVDPETRDCYTQQ